MPGKWSDETNIAAARWGGYYVPMTLKVCGQVDGWHSRRSVRLTARCGRKRSESKALKGIAHVWTVALILHET